MTHRSRTQSNRRRDRAPLEPNRIGEGIELHCAEGIDRPAASGRLDRDAPPHSALMRMHSLHAPVGTRCSLACARGHSLLACMRPCALAARLHANGCQALRPTLDGFAVSSQPRRGAELQRPGDGAGLTTGAAHALLFDKTQHNQHLINFAYIPRFCIESVTTCGSMPRTSAQWGDCCSHTESGTVGDLQ
jgi:hypothetical protein